VAGSTCLEEQRPSRLDVRDHRRSTRISGARPAGPRRAGRRRIAQDSERDGREPDRDGDDRCDPEHAGCLAALGYAAANGTDESGDDCRVSVAHAGLAIAVAVATVASLVASLAIAMGRDEARVWLDRAILAVLALVAANVLLGLGFVALGHAPTDLLHVVYAAAALVVLPATRWAGRSRELRRRGLWVAGGSIVLFGILLRLAQTG
jgi:hypothetical protein